MSDAEKVKREEGMKNEKARVLFEKLLEPILLEIRTALAYYKNSQNAEIKEVILVGGSSQLPGLKEYFTDILKVSVSHGSPFLLPAPLDVNDLSRLHYIEALGLALRGLDKKWERINPSLKL